MRKLSQGDSLLLNIAELKIRMEIGEQVSGSTLFHIEGSCYESGVGIQLKMDTERFG